MSLSYPFPLLRELPGECLERLTQDYRVYFSVLFVWFMLCLDPGGRHPNEMQEKAGQESKECVYYFFQ